jgi:uncharacterized protein
MNEEENSIEERAVVFPCQGEHLLGIVSLPSPAKSADLSVRDTGLVVVVGGPQYRVGSHRQFLLLGRAVASAGFPVLRFDVRGMGDSTGKLHTFEHIAPDIGAAIDALQKQAPQVKRVALWGLCDGASAALLYCGDTKDVRVRGLFLLNPWVRSEATLARTHLKHYYVDRLRQKAFWRKLLSGKVASTALIELWQKTRKMRSTESAPEQYTAMTPFPERMAQSAISLGSRRIMLVLSGNDFTAKEFCELAQTDRQWASWLDDLGANRHDLPKADHTFSNSTDSSHVQSITISWLQSSNQ